MPWFLPFPDSIKKRACRYLLQRYLGQFLDEKLTLDQLTVDLYNGKGTVTEVYLDVQALNSLGEKKNFPFEFVDGYIDKLSVTIPWSSLLTDSSSVEVEGMVLTIQPKEYVDTGMSMFESMWSSMTSSMQMAAECMQQEPKETEQCNPLECVELFAQTIDSILTRVQVNFKRTLIRVEHLPKDCTTGVRLEIQIMNVDYFDEAGINSVCADQPAGEKSFQTVAFTASKFSCEGVTFYTDEFAAEHRIESRSYIKSDHVDSDMDFVAAKSDINNRVLFSKLAGRQEIRIKLKQGSAQQGPKVEFELNLGSLTTFCSPRQLHLLSELAKGFESAGSDDNNIITQPRNSHKPMDIYDFQRVEQQLMHQLYPVNTGLKGNKGFQCMQGWSTAPLGGDESDDEFQPAKGVRTRSGVADSRHFSESSSVFSDATSLEGSMISNSSSTTFLSKSPSDVYNTPSLSTTPTRSKSKRKGSSGDGDPNAEMSTFHICIGSVAFILLHEDIMISCPDTNLLAPGSVADMTMVAKNFFKNIGLTSAAGGYGGRDFSAANEMFTKACQLSHIRLLAAPVIIEGDEKTTNSSKLVSAVITAASVEILECLIEKSPNAGEDTIEYVELLKFMRSYQKKENPLPNGPISSQPDLWLHFKRVERIGKSAHNHIPHTEITVNLQQCWSEVDISIVDRISTVLNAHSICQPLKKNVHSCLNQHRGFYQAVESTTETRTDLKIKSPFMVIRLRIPIPDLRPAEDFDRVPWWKRSIRDDILVFHLFDCQLTTGWNTSCPEREFDLQCKEVCAFFQEGNCSPVQFARTFSEDQSKNFSLLDRGQMFGLPRFNLKISPWQKPADLEDIHELEREDSTTMVQSIVMETPEKEPSPFSSKKIVHESDTPHTVECEGEELIIPGDKDEMSEFINVASQNTRIKIDISLPCLAVNFPSKHLYEVIYNRVNSDLLLWESSAPKLRSSHSELNNPSGVGSFYPDTHFSTCKPGTQYDEDDEDADSSSEDNDSMHYNMWDQHRLKKQPIRPQYKGQSRLALSLNIGQGRLNSCVGVRDSKGSEFGEMQMSFKDISLFSVAGYQGRSHNNYICLQINYINLLHNGNVDPNIVRSGTSHLNIESSTTPSHLQPTIYKTEPGAVANSNAPPVGNGSGNSKDMFSLAVRTHYDNRGDKIVRVACGIRGATLRHRVTTGKYNWFNQLLQFFEVVDYPVPGYSPPQVVTELHQHLWDCAIDYRPLNLPLRSFVTMGNLSISSNMVAHTNSSTLRFIAEDVCLFISDKVPNFVDLKTDYVCVLDIGLFELSLRLADNPHVDLRASNNIVHIRTCSDSARALGQLITYFACDGDLTEQKPPPKEERTVSADLSNNKNTSNALTESTVERVNILMEDAMLDVHGPQGIVSRDGQRTEGVQVFFFPDEKGGGVVSNLSPSCDCDWAASDIDSDSDFCILDHEAGSGMIPQNGLPEIRMLTNGPIRVVDNHFSLPASKADHLQAPSNYPPPILRYSLREMTLVWHMYGGKDFQIECPQKKHVTVVESEKTNHVCKRDSYTQGTTVAFSTARPQEVNLNPAVCQHQQKSLTENYIPSRWQDRGGKGRQHDVLMELQLNKVRFHYEVYGKNCVQASRQVLTVQELEIRDRLASSRINKFLYQYTSEARPKQSQANMVTVKAVHLRPDPKTNVQECCLKVTMLPLRLNIDQDSLLFLLTFSNEISGITKEDGDTERAIIPHCPSQAPVMSVETQELVRAGDASQTTSKQGTDDKSTLSSVPSLSSSSPIFFRSFVFTPEVPIRLDYEGKRVDMTHGPLAGLLMGLAQLSCSELRLKRLEHKHGLLGLEKLLSYMFAEWFQDIKKNQLPNLIGGVGPIHSLIQLFQGIIDLFWLPIEQYQKDGRIVRGLQRGANSFTTSTAMAALEITTRLVQAIQSVAETAFDMVSPGPSVRNKKHGRKTRYNQPADIREGVSTAISLVREGLGETAQTLVRVASAEHETKGAVGAVGGVLRQLPPTVVTPIILASAATNNLLGGVRSQLVPDARREHTFKWRSEV